MTALLLVLGVVLGADGGSACSINLCGDPLRGEQACYCAPLPRGCWDREEDCEAWVRCLRTPPGKDCVAKVKRDRARDGGR